jgi:D-alanyl-D-alanine carboxypeptidase/D-alanyl-D-alanine-endopeptidase (penicillin-binding protein 4)
MNLLKSNLNCNIHSGSIENYNNKKLISIASQPRDSVLKKMMSRSDNFYAEQVLLMASNQLLGYMSEDKMIDTLLKKDFIDMPQKTRWVDGSGLSRYNLFSPNDFIYVIKKIINEFGLSTLKNMLPTGGTGTLKNMLVVDSGFVFAKTGSFSNNYNISGLLVTKKNKPLLFSIMVNHYIGNSKALRKKIEIFIHQIRENN